MLAGRLQIEESLAGRQHALRDQQNQIIQNNVLDVAAENNEHLMIASILVPMKGRHNESHLSAQEVVNEQCHDLKISCNQHSHQFNHQHSHQYNLRNNSSNNYLLLITTILEDSSKARPASGEMLIEITLLMLNNTTATKPTERTSCC
jgi:hypothetical protein